MSEKKQAGRTYKSHTFKCGAKWTGERTWDITLDEAQSLKGGPPPVFKGEPGTWPPENLILAGINTCTLATFVSYCARKDFEFISYESEIEGLLEHDGKIFRFTRMIVRPRIVVKSEEDISKAEEYIHRAHDLCFMSNSVNAEITVEPEIVVG